MSDNTCLWEAARFVDPKYTKEFSRAGGFRGRATNATYLMRRATEVFGPVGIGWGWSIVDERYSTGGPILTSDGVVLGTEIIHSVHIKLWYVFHDQRGEIEHFGQTQFVGRNKNGIFTDEEAPKKSLTDAITKSLSCIGFAADIHMGLWDDSKYVAGMEHEANQHNGGNGDKAKLTQQFKDSIAAETPRNGDQLVAEKYALDKAYAPYLKETPKGICWKVTAIQQAMRDFVHDLEGQSDADELKRFLADNAAALDACAVALPNWYYGKSGSDVPGIEKRIGDKKVQLSLRVVDDPSRYLRA